MCPLKNPHGFSEGFDRNLVSYQFLVFSYQMCSHLSAKKKECFYVKISGDCLKKFLSFSATKIIISSSPPPLHPLREVIDACFCLDFVLIFLYFFYRIIMDFFATSASKSLPVADQLRYTFT